MRIQRPMAHQHRERLLRRPAVQPELVASGRGVRLPAPREQARADVPGCTAFKAGRLGSLAGVWAMTHSGHSEAIIPRDGWGHVGCPTCGFVGLFPLSRGEDEPWCPHVERVLWKGSEPGEPSEHWTRMVPVVVHVASDEERHA
jgi:hypothetical protein